MRLRALLISLFALLALLPGCASTTPTEAAATAAARQDPTAYTLPPDKLVKAIRISHFYQTLSFARTGWGIVSLLLMLQFGIAARIRNLAVEVTGNRWAQCFVFMPAFVLVLTLLALPLGVFGHHAAVQDGFSIQHWPGWFGDQAKSFLLTALIAMVFAVLVQWVIGRSPRRWWLWLWFPTIVIVLFSTYVAPFVVDPLFNTFEPLASASPALAEQIERVAVHGHIDIPTDRMFLMKASAKTTLLNAYVTGFGASKRLVIWDTVLAKATPDEIALMAGHEMGHYVLGHVLRGVVISFAGILLAFYVGFHLFQWLLRRFGDRWRVAGQDDLAALVAMMLVLSVLSFFAQPIANSISRGMEQDADIFGLEAVHGIVADPSATGQAEFQMLGENSFDEPNPSPLLEFWTDSHPSISFRAAFAKHYRPWAAGNSPKFFRK